MYIKKDALDFILGVSGEVYPNEFGAMLRAEKDTITEVLIIPGTTFGDSFTSTPMDMIPIDASIIGSFHSHPGKSFSPSDEDINFFGHTGKIHLIARYPYRNINDVAAYNYKGERIPLELINK
jgi:proteasome lid subunit RPN8/RPN11